MVKAYRASQRRQKDKTDPEKLERIRQQNRLRLVEFTHKLNCSIQKDRACDDQSNRGFGQCMVDN